MGTDAYSGRAKLGFFPFGRTLRIESRDLLTTLEAFVPRSRNVVIVGHKVKGDLKLLADLGFDLKTSIIGCLDTNQLHRGERVKDVSLHQTLQELRYTAEEHLFHVGGNDTYLASIAMILLAIQSHTLAKEATGMEGKLVSMEVIIKQPLPDIPILARRRFDKWPKHIAPSRIARRKNAKDPKWQEQRLEQKRELQANHDGLFDDDCEMPDLDSLVISSGNEALARQAEKWERTAARKAREAKEEEEEKRRRAASGPSRGAIKKTRRLERYAKLCPETISGTKLYEVISVISSDISQQRPSDSENIPPRGP